MAKDSVTIRASKFVFDTGYRVKNYSADSIAITRKEDRMMVFVPKSLCHIEDLPNHEKRITIEKWFCTNTDENKRFFKNEL